MPCEVNRTVNFGTTKSGLRHVGYCLLNTKGAIVHARTERGVHEVGEGTGIYAAMVCFPDQFRGTVLWDTGQARPSYAAEEYNYYDNNDVMLEQMKYVFSQLSFLRGLQAGRWALKKETAEMTFYDETGENMLVSYAMMDSNGKPSLEEVFDRVVNEINAPEYPPPITDPPTDNPPNYELSPSDTNPKEGDVVNFSVATNRLVNKLYWTLEPVASAASAGDFRLLSTVNNSGIVPLDSGTGTFTLALADDLITEGDETFTVNLRYGAADGEIVATSTITVKDTSTTPPPPPPPPVPTYSLTPDSTAVDEGGTIDFQVGTTNFGSGSLYWTVGAFSGSITSTDFSSLPDVTYVSGTVVINDNSGSFSIPVTNDLLTEDAETFTVFLRAGGTSGDIVDSSVVTINDTSTTPVPPPPPPPPPPVVTRNQVIYMTTPGEDDEQPDPLGPLPAFLNTVNIVQVAMGYEFALALDDTGRVYAWGNESFYSITSVPPEAQTGVKKITAGTNFAYVLKTDGTVVGWGDPAGNRFDYTGLTGITDIASAWNDTLFIDSNRKAHHRGERTYDLTDWAYGIDGIAVGRFNIAANQFGWAKVKGLPNNGALNIDPDLEAGIEWIHAVGGTSFFARAANGTIVGWGNDSARLLTGVLDLLEDYPDVTSTYQALGTESGLVKLYDPNRRLGRFFNTSVYAAGMIDAVGHINTWGLFAGEFTTPATGAISAATYDRNLLIVVKGS